MTDATMPDEAVDTTPDTEAADIPANEPVEEEITPELEADGIELPEAEETPEAEPEEVEFKFGAKTIKLPKTAMPDDLRDEVQKFVNEAEASTTRKHQELSEMRKTVEARAEAVLKFQQMGTALQEKFSEGLAIRKELDQWAQVDLNSMWQSNPDEARRVSDHLTAQRGKLQSIIAEVNHAEMSLGQAQTAEAARQDAEGRSLIEKKIKGFSQKAPEVIEYAVKEFGVDRREAEQYGLNPVAAIAMYKAMQYDRMMAAASKQGKPKAPVAPVTAKATGGAAKPVRTVGDIANLPMDQYAAAMNKLDRQAQAKRPR